MKDFFSGISKSPSFPAFVMYAILFVIGCFVTTGFISVPYINSFFASNAPLIILAIGMSMVIITGGIDLSVGAVVTVVNVVIVTMFENGCGIPETIIIGIIVGLAFGVLNGVMIGLLRVNALMMTFAVQSICSGLALWIMNRPQGSSPTEFVDGYNTRIGGFFPVAGVIIGICLVVTILIMRSPIGLKIYAIGQNEQSAFFSGINVGKTKLFAYMYSGLFAGIAGICMTGYIGGGDPTIGMGLTLTCVAACVIGGLSLAGGKGTCVGGLWGAMFLQLIITLIVSFGVTTMQQLIVKGLIIFAGIAGTVIIARRRSSNPEIRMRNAVEEARK